MESRAKVFGHPAHPMLVMFPAALLITSLGFDAVHLITRNALWGTMAYYLIGVGVATGLAAAAFGTWDWLAIPHGTRAKRIGLWHGLGNVAMLALFAIGWYLRRNTPELPWVIPPVLSLIGVGLMVVTAWIGGEMIYRLGVGVDDGANLDAPNSLGSRAVSDTESFTARKHIGEEADTAASTDTTAVHR